MESPPRITRLLTLLGEAAKVVAARFRPKPEALAMIGLPPSARGLKAIPDDIEERLVCCTA